ncbi:hypothetical protein D3C80_1158760 [compost metagenome]
MVTVYFKLRGYDLQQLLFDLFDVFPRRKMGTITDAEDMGVDGDRRPAKGGVKDDVRCFTSHPRQGFQCLTVFGNFASVLFQQDTTRLNNVLRLAVKQADGFDIGFHTLDAERQNGLWRVRDRIKFCRRFVHADVGCLRGKKD